MSPSLRSLQRSSGRARKTASKACATHSGTLPHSKSQIHVQGPTALNATTPPSGAYSWIPLTESTRESLTLRGAGSGVGCTVAGGFVSSGVWGLGAWWRALGLVLRVEHLHSGTSSACRKPCDTASVHGMCLVRLGQQRRIFGAAGKPEPTPSPRPPYPGTEEFQITFDKQTIG